MSPANPQIFREYDIRGVADRDLTDEAVRQIGQAFAQRMSERKKRLLCVGRDVRLSSPRIRDALVQGLNDQGARVIDVGQVPTPALYYAVLHLKADGGVMVTGSHNPIEYNGLKLSDGVSSLHGDEIQDLRLRTAGVGVLPERGTVETASVDEDYLDDLRSRITLKRKLRVVVDPGNGAASILGPALIRALGCEVDAIFAEPDGRFPNHLPDPTVPALMRSLQERVRETGADLGIGFDGDADRIGAVDEKGRLLYGDQLLALYAADVLVKHQGEPIIFEVKCSQGLVEWIQAKGGKPIMWKAGHSLIKAKMRETKAPLGGEMSGHMFFADEFPGYDDALYAAGRLLRLLAAQKRPLSELVDELPQSKYVSTPELRLDCTDERKFAIVDAVREHFASRHEVIDIDGARVQFGDGWALIRASNTQPVLVVRFEAVNQERLQAIAREVYETLAAFPEVKVPALQS
ncbi:MAG TPA: phosphomannomutase/phosphoglucomutase [Candidatus Polarisedimenticolia bacterium]|nr:phosphomannomutase/phosphoglucomutase [Candidatus Polarisedimenticolia bacterium]